MEALVRDAWLEGLLGRPAFRVSAPGALTPADMKTLAETRAFAYAKVDAAGIPAARRIEELGFQIAEVNVRMQKPLDGSRLPLSDYPRVRLAEPADEEAVAAIARAGFSQTRFHMDPRVPRDRADAVKEAWARNYFSGLRGDAMVVAEDGGEVAGFVLLLGSAGREPVADLVCVRQASRNRGLGRDMMLAAEGLAPVKATMTVGTQLVNTGSIRLYEGIGYRLAGAQYVFHYHGRGAA
jgi:GNAT superfamily N-acetyltransferase